MNKILYDTNYNPPSLIPYKDDNIRVEFSPSNLNVLLFLDSKLLMTYNYTSHSQALEVLSHYYLAKGHCICTGLGFAVRENWIATKKEVTKITVIEKNKKLIDYHKKIGTKFSSKIEIIHGDALEYKGKCDTLLLDHYESIKEEDLFLHIKEISKNIEHTNMFFWQLENIIIDYCNFNIDDMFNFYNSIRIKYYKTLPIISKELLYLFLLQSPIADYNQILKND
jgi:hypothetical protein